MLNFILISKQYKNRPMQIALIWWTIPAIVAISSTFFVIVTKIQHPEIQIDREEYLGIQLISLMYFSLGFSAFYILCVLSYYFVKKHTQSNLLWDIIYTKEEFQKGENNCDSA